MLARSFARKAVSLSSSSIGATRSIQKSTVNCFAAGHGHDAGSHGHDDHHPHPMWSSLPFSKKTTGVILAFVFFGGVGTVCFAAVHQNIKHGFWK